MLELEKKLWQKGFKYIAGVDEAGRGALAGPIVAGAVIFPKKIIKLKKELREIKDSKLLSPKKREELFKFITKNCLSWAISKISEKVIDRIGISKANQLVSKKVIKKLKKQPDFILVDGRINLDCLKIPYQSIVKADKKIFSCSAASILAKVWRDNLMKRIDKKYPFYGFKRHKGYGTKYHYQQLNCYGPSPCHRRSFRLK
ncbi:MAG: ribonuclease HII [Patescibacteria group bacterium]